jgi:hypothetical protein
MVALVVVQLLIPQIKMTRPHKENL